LVYANNTKLFTGIVASVINGDTIRANFGSKKVTVKLACINAPEMKQKPWGKQSADTLKKLLPRGKSIKVRLITTDKNKRLIGEVYVGNTSINLAMVQKGQAVVYPEYLSQCTITQNQFLQSQAVSKHKKIGFWHQSKPVMARFFRKPKKVGSSSTNGSSYVYVHPYTRSNGTNIQGYYRSKPGIRVGGFGHSRTGGAHS